MKKKKNGHDELLRTVKSIRALTEDILEYESVDTRRAYEKVNRRIRSRNPRYRIWRAVLFRVAAVLLLPLLLSATVLFRLYKKEKAKSDFVSYQVVESAPGTVTRFLLPDSSQVWLNGGSTLRYPERFVAGAREVVLSGEAYFCVSSDTKHPFYVTTHPGVKVMAYGTRFNVMAYDDEPYIEAVLEKGKIDMLATGFSVSLNPSDQVLFERGTGKMTVTKVNLEEKTAWREGRLVFRNTPLQDILKRLAKRYNVTIVLHKNNDRIYRYRAAFTTENITQILNYLKLTAPIDWTITDIRQRDDSSLVQQRIDVYLK